MATVLSLPPPYLSQQVTLPTSQFTLPGVRPPAPTDRVISVHLVALVSSYQRLAPHVPGRTPPTQVRPMTGGARANNQAARKDLIRGSEQPEER